MKETNAHIELPTRMFCVADDRVGLLKRGGALSGRAGNRSS